METFVPILLMLIQLAVLGGIVAGIVVLVSRRDRRGSHGGGVTVRRFFLYALMLGTLVVTGVGIGGLLAAAVSATSRVTGDATSVALSLALTLVGAPVFMGLTWVTLRRLDGDPDEQRSLGWSFYLTVALVGSLITVVVLAISVLTTLVEDARLDGARVAHLVVWAAVWAGHWLVARRWPPGSGIGTGTPAHVLAGSAVGLAVTFSGSLGLVSGSLGVIYDTVWLDTILGGGAADLVRSMIVVVVGVPVWWWYWFRHARRADHTPLWVAYVLLLGVLGGVVTVVSGAGIAVHAVVQWVIGDPSTASAAAHFASLPGALAALIVGGVTWLYHANVLGDRAGRTRTEVDRIYDYLLSGAGLVVAAAGTATLVAAGLDGLVGGELTGSSGNVTAVALTLLAVGVPLWWRRWSVVLGYRRDDPDAELRSTTRRIYIFSVFGIAAVVAVIDLIIVLFSIFDDLLGDGLGSATVLSISVPLGLLVTTGAIAWYHQAVFKEDRADEPEPERKVLREVVVVAAGEDPLIGVVGDTTDAPVRVLFSTAPPVTVGSLAEVAEKLAAAGFERVVIVARPEGGYDLIPIEG